MSATRKYMKFDRTRRFVTKLTVESVENRLPVEEPQAEEHNVVSNYCEHCLKKMTPKQSAETQTTEPFSALTLTDLNKKTREFSTPNKLPSISEVKLITSSSSELSTASTVDSLVITDFKTY